MIFTLPDTDIHFPNPSLAEQDGLLAIGGNLDSETLIQAYSAGIFPWFSDNEPICWYAPLRRCVIFPTEILISKSLQKILQKKVFTVTCNTVFAEVIQACKHTLRKNQDGTWITNEMEHAYTKLHTMGIAQSVEVWQNNILVGGLYGIKMNTVFCGESMFSLVSNASKVALAWLCEQPEYSLIDCQIPNPHLISMGAVMIEQKEYVKLLAKTN